MSTFITNFSKSIVRSEGICLAFGKMPLNLRSFQAVKDCQDLRCFFGNPHPSPLPKRERGIEKIDLLPFGGEFFLSVSPRLHQQNRRDNFLQRAQGTGEVKAGGISTRIELK